MDLEEFKYDFNYVTTKTGVWRDRCYVNFKKEEQPINYLKSINFKSMVEEFNKKYWEYYKDLIKVPKLDNYDLQYLSYNDYRDSEYLTFIIDKGQRLLTIKRENEEINYFISKVYDQHTDFDLTKKTYLDKNILGEYLNLFKKHNLFIGAYDKLKNKFIGFDGTTVISIRIKGDILKELSTIKVTLANLFFNREDFCSFSFDLGQYFKLNDEFKIQIKEQSYQDKDKIDSLINDLYLNNEYLPFMFRKDKEMTLERRIIC